MEAILKFATWGIKQKAPSLDYSSGKVQGVLGRRFGTTGRSSCPIVRNKSVTGKLNKMAVNSVQQFDVETIERFSGGRRDLARLASYAGVLNTDDSRNDICAGKFLMALKGCSIPNPNHFAVAGTTGGPVSALNINLLKRSNFLRGAFPADMAMLPQVFLMSIFEVGILIPQLYTNPCHGRFGIGNGGTTKKRE